MASHSSADGVPAYTKCQLQNHAGNKQHVTLDMQNYWHGSADPPKTIQDQNSGDFKHNADAGGAIGGVAYVLGDKLKWIIAWSNAEKMPNKVYTQIFSKNEAINWETIKASLDSSGNQSSDPNKLGYSSEAVIDKHSDTPTMTATLKPAS